MHEGLVPLLVCLKLTAPFAIRFNFCEKFAELCEGPNAERKIAAPAHKSGDLDGNYSARGGDFF